jgi:hypothetical protein
MISRNRRACSGSSIAPSRNVSFGGWIYNFVPLFGMTVTY